MEGDHYATGLHLDEEAMAMIVGKVVSQLSQILLKTITASISVCMTTYLNDKINEDLNNMIGD